VRVDRPVDGARAIAVRLAERTQPAQHHRDADVGGEIDFVVRAGQVLGGGPTQARAPISVSLYRALQALRSADETRTHTSDRVVATCMATDLRIT
jgi:hypothetical protein